MLLSVSERAFPPSSGRSVLCDSDQGNPYQQGKFSNFFALSLFACASYGIAPSLDFIINHFSKIMQEEENSCHLQIYMSLGNKLITFYNSFKKNLCFNMMKQHSCTSEKASPIHSLP